jgi:uncharacterized protein YhfF
MGLTLEDALARYPGAQSYAFGDSATLNAEVLALVREGRKTVTCEALAAFEERGESLPQPGRIDIATDWSGRPVMALRTLTVQHLPFDEMTEDLVADQGEFRDLAEWRQGYQAYLTRSGYFAPDVMMLVERFEVVEVFT